MGFIYEIKEDYNRAYLCYEHALEYANKDIKNNILEMMSNLRGNYNVNVNPYSSAI